MYNLLFVATLQFHLLQDKFNKYLNHANEGTSASNPNSYSKDLIPEGNFSLKRIYC